MKTIEEHPGVGANWEESCPEPPERAALEAVLASRHFAKAPLLSSFLRFVVETALLRPDSRITEQEIGVLVFHRAEGYDPGEDNIVRNYARQLRRRLESYYREEGAADSIQIEIPKGGYVAIFRPRSMTGSDLLHLREETAIDTGDEAGPEETLAAGSAEPTGSWRLHRLRQVSIALVALLLFVSGGVAWHFFGGFLKRSPLHPLWSQIFQSDRNTAIVPADVGFVILQQLNNRTFSLADYESWGSVEQYDHSYMSFLKAQKYTSVLDLETVSRIERLPEIVPSRLSMRAARTLSMEDLANDNLILLGSNYSNPWVTVFEPGLNFRFVNQPAQGRSWIQNVHPLPGEAATYEITTRSITHETYAVIALVPNLEHSGRVLIVEGIDGPGTQAAVDLLMEGDPLAPIIKKAARPDGSIGGFEVLIAAASLDTRATGIRIVAVRYLH